MTYTNLSDQDYQSVQVRNGTLFRALNTVIWLVLSGKGDGRSGPHCSLSNRLLQGSLP